MLSEQTISNYESVTRSRCILPIFQSTDSVINRLVAGFGQQVGRWIPYNRLWSLHALHFCNASRGFDESVFCGVDYDWFFTGYPGLELRFPGIVSGRLNTMQQFRL